MLCQEHQHLFREYLVKPKKSCGQKGADWCPRALKTLFFFKLQGFAGWLREAVWNWWTGLLDWSTAMA